MITKIIMIVIILIIFSNFNNLLLIRKLSDHYVFDGGRGVKNFEINCLQRL